MTAEVLSPPLSPLFISLGIYFYLWVYVPVCLYAIYVWMPVKAREGKAQDGGSCAQG